MKKFALISVSDRTGLVPFAKALQLAGYGILCTSGTGKFLSDNGVVSSSIEEYTAQREILGGRVKTLHPKIYAGILARRNVPGDLEQLAQDGIHLIDLVVVNLYPFLDKRTEGRSRDEMIEFIDIGGPSMVRAAAKNFQSVLPIIDPRDYGEVGEALRMNSVSTLLRERLAAKVFAYLANDALGIASYFSASPEVMPEVSAGSTAFSDQHFWGIALERNMALRYGENPAQKGSFYLPVEWTRREVATKWRQLGGKELSYNNLLDCDAMLRILGRCSDLVEAGQIGAVIIKHLNPCGAGFDPDAAVALKKAKRCDPRSHFGGVVGFTGQLSIAAAQSIREDFCEIVIAPEFGPGVLEVLRQSKNLRIIQADPAAVLPDFEVRTALDGYLVQSSDRLLSAVRAAEAMTTRALLEEDERNLQIAWAICSQVKSNAIVLVSDGLLIGVGAGQMSRIDSVEVALMKARVHGHNLRGAVAASDAFFPFPDGVEKLIEVGVSAIIAPRGAKRDADVVAAAEAGGITLLFAPDRHFRH